MDCKLVELKGDVTKNLSLDLYFKLKKEEDRLDVEISKYAKRGVDTDLKPQMELLHKYNCIKDATQRILGYLADIDQTTVKDLHIIYNLPIN